MDTTPEEGPNPGAVATAKAQSPQSEAVANELQELSLQPAPNLLPIEERKNVLQLKLQQRRTREELVSQGIMPPLKSPAAFHEQRRSLERARTEDYLKRKIRSRPERAELVRMHILEETSAEPSLQAKQLQLKRARLADDLNDKISHRPGPMELIHKNILPVHSSLKQVLIETDFSRVIGEGSSFDEDSSDALSPDQPANQDSPLGNAPLPSPPDQLVNHNTSPTEFLLQAPPPPPPLPIVSGPSPSQRLTNGTAIQRPTPGLVKPSQTKAASERPPQRPKKPKDSKPKVKKLKYHQYIPPDQKAEREPPPQLDSTYAKILHQQQLFLQLQIISQQQQHYNYHTILPAPPKPPVEQQHSATAITPTTTTGPSPSRSVPPTASTSNQSGSNRQAIQLSVGAKFGVLPPNLDELKVAELKQELKMRALPVSGTKNDLIERLRNFQEQHGGAPCSGTSASGSKASAAQPQQQLQASMAHQQQQQQQQVCTSSPVLATTRAPLLHQSGDGSVVLAAFPFVATVGGTGQGCVQTQPQPQVMRFGSTSSSPPVSPAPSEHSLAGLSPDRASCNGDAFGEMVSSPLTQLSLQPSPPQHHVKEEAALAGPAPCRYSQQLRPRAAQPQARPPPQRRSLLDKDRMLLEKDKQIQELTRMLLQKQQLVETLRLQLEMGKQVDTAVASTTTTTTTTGTSKASQPVGGVVRVKEEPPDMPAYRCLSPVDAIRVTVKEEVAEEGEEEEVIAEEGREGMDMTTESAGSGVGFFQMSPQQREVSAQQQREAVQAQLELLRLQQAQKLKQLQMAQQQQQQQQQKTVLQHNQTNLQRRSHQRKRKPQKIHQQDLIRQHQQHQQQQEQQQPPQQQQTQLSTQQISQVFVNQQTVSTSSFPLDILKNHPAPTLVKDSNGNHFLISLTNHNIESQGPNSTQGKKANEITLQRLQSTPAKLPSQSQQICQSTSQSKKSNQSGTQSQSTKKGHKMGLQVSTNQTPEATTPMSAPPSLQPFFPSTDSTPSPNPTPSPPVHMENGSTQQMDDLFDILIESGEISANFKPAPDPAMARLKVDSPSPSSPDPSHIHLSPPTPHSPNTPPLISDALGSDAPEGSPDHGGGSHCESVTGEGRLEDFLETSTGTPLLGAEPGGPLPLIDDLHSQMLSTPSILDHPPSPMDTYELGYSAPTTGLDFADAALDTMDWLDITMGENVGPGGSRGGDTSPAHGTSLTVAPAGPPVPTSIFSADFLDSPDLQLHWDSCL